MTNVSYRLSERLARRSSRRQFFKFMSGTALGAGLWLARADVTLGTITSCSGCPGGPCNPCHSIYPDCASIGENCHLCPYGGCPSDCITTGEWYCCLTFPKCRQRCSECSCGAGCCHCFIITTMPCAGSSNPCVCP
jgi:hypothetical protein